MEPTENKNEAKLKKPNNCQI